MRNMPVPQARGEDVQAVCVCVCVCVCACGRGGGGGGAEEAGVCQHSTETGRQAPSPPLFLTHCPPTPPTCSSGAPVSGLSGIASPSTSPFDLHTC